MRHGYALGLAVTMMAGATVPAIEATPPDGVQQLIPRGAIPAVFEPHYVPAAEAEISDDAWVLGVEIEGQARAYSLNLLNHHEVVNTTVGGRDIAAVW